ncbi:MAG: iron-containing alcohol dehydrogenase, partial [Pirellulales bacterium]|nr:iron-containing alcohol dehydrogenase [Pirellulales bacterium]
PVALRVNQKIAKRDLARLDQALGGERLPAEESAQRLNDRIVELCRLAGTPTRLSEFGLRRERISWLAKHSGGNSMKGNPAQLTSVELESVLESVY